MHGHDGRKEITPVAIGVTTKVLQVRCELRESVVGFVTIQFITDKVGLIVINRAVPKQHVRTPKLLPFINF
jgi:hypothetical protein